MNPPQNLYSLVCMCVTVTYPATGKKDGYLTSSEYSIWASTMKLDENEAPPTLRPPHFLSLPGDMPPPVAPGARILSLWEWRHWQNRPLPTHWVEHSERCLHFTSIMELTDRLRQDDEVRGQGSGCGQLPGYRNTVCQVWKSQANLSWLQEHSLLG